MFENQNLFETLPGGEPIIIDKVPALLYCGGCMKEMRCIHGTSFECPRCGMHHEKEEAV